jgi:hypothetical protein
MRKFFLIFFNIFIVKTGKIAAKCLELLTVVYLNAIRSSIAMNKMEKRGKKGDFMRFYRKVAKICDFNG